MTIHQSLIPDVLKSWREVIRDTAKCFVVKWQQRQYQLDEEEEEGAELDWGFVGREEAGSAIAVPDPGMFLFSPDQVQ